MNSPYESLDNLNDWSWYDPSEESTPSIDEDHALDSDAFSVSLGDFAHFPQAWQAQPWTNTTSVPTLTGLEQQPQHQHYEFRQEQQVWCVASTSVPHQYWQALPSPVTRETHHNAGPLHIPHANAAIASSPPLLDSAGITTADPCTFPCNTTSDQLAVTPERLRTLFPLPTLPRHDPPALHALDGQPLQKLTPRFEGDLYQALWIRGEGASREGWCGHCPSWHKLKDSAYWYHLHYTHGVACSTGRPFERPLQLRWSLSTNMLEALCRSCGEWVSIGRGLKMRSAYWRHAYKCMVKGVVKPQSRSPRKRQVLPDL